MKGAASLPACRRGSRCHRGGARQPARSGTRPCRDSGWDSPHSVTRRCPWQAIGQPRPASIARPQYGESRTWPRRQHGRNRFAQTRMIPLRNAIDARVSGHVRGRRVRTTMLRVRAKGRFAGSRVSGFGPGIPKVAEGDDQGLCQADRGGERTEPVYVGVAHDKTEARVAGKRACQ